MKILLYIQLFAALSVMSYRTAYESVCAEYGTIVSVVGAAGTVAYVQLESGHIVNRSTSDGPVVIGDSACVRKAEKPRPWVVNLIGDKHENR